MTVMWPGEDRTLREDPSGVRRVPAPQMVAVVTGRAHNPFPSLLSARTCPRSRIRSIVPPVAAEFVELFAGRGGFAVTKEAGIARGNRTW